MLPRKSKDFIQSTAEKLSCDENLVDDVISFYWQQVRDALSKPKNIAITVANFGVFSIKPWKVDQFIVKYNGIMDNTDHTNLDTFTKFATIKQLEKKKIIIDKLVIQLEEQKLKKQSVKEKRYGKTDNDSLEK